MQIEASMIIPTIQVYRDYFDSKYPCTDESNDGSDMPIEDEIRYQVYEYLLNAYNKMPDIFKGEYNKIKELALKSETQNLNK